MLMKRKQLTAPFENNDLGFLADSSMYTISNCTTLNHPGEYSL